MRILGIDPALNKTGWGVVDVTSDNMLQFISSGIIKVDLGHTLLQKLEFISSQIIKIIDDYSPDEISIEETFLNKNPSTSLKLGHARGAIITSCLTRGSNNIYEYGANKIKKSVCGAGKAEKIQVAMMVKRILPKAAFTHDDESDALAAAICHIYNRNALNYLDNGA